MKKYIHIEKKDREFLQKAFGITDRAVFNALHYESDSDGSELMRKVRTVALERGGIVMVEAPEAETLFDNDGYMRQYLPKGVLLEFKYEDNSCTVYVKGEEVRKFEHVFVSDIPYIQEYAGRFYGADAQRRRTKPMLEAAAMQRPTQPQRQLA